MSERMITVCAKCLQASCLQGIFMCWDSRYADITKLPESKLRELAREHPDYWLTDEEIWDGVAPGKQVRV